MTEIQLKSEILKYINEHPFATKNDIHTHIYQLGVEKELIINLFDTIALLIQSEKLIDASNGRFVLNEKGFEIQKKGGYEAIWNENISKAIERKVLEQIENETKVNQHKLSKWQVKYYWIPFIVSGLSLFLSAIALIINYIKK